MFSFLILARLTHPFLFMVVFYDQPYEQISHEQYCKNPVAAHVAMVLWSGISLKS